MFPLPLLPTVPDDLEKMKGRRALLYQNTFMKNALIRALNIIYGVAPKLNGSHFAFRQFMEYVETVCDMTSLHIQGDEVFCKSLAQHCKAYRWTSNRSTAVVQDSLKSLRRLVRDWKKDNKSYHYTRLQGCLSGMEAPIIEVLHKQVAKFSGDVLPQSISDEQMRVLITDNMIWLGSNSDISILLPFCMSHHDIKTSKYWPPVTQDAIKAMPELVKEHPTLWKFSPFDPISRSGQKCLF
ncbi:hypothetical protein BDZ97DRAFT_1337100 [Flammula alnicola]|nr:hypothetical protein BDZ97DRAFT_1337100 [Flammula alnicola]